MKELLLEYLAATKQVEKFKTWLVDIVADTEEGISAWVDSEIENFN